MVATLAAPAIRTALTTRDLSDPAQGSHSMQVLVGEIEQALVRQWAVEVLRVREHPVVSVHENYDRLRIPPDAVARDVRYTRYLNDETVLRTHTSAIVPPALDRLAPATPTDVLLSCPGICYRRDVIDRHHVGQPHQLDLWRVRTAGTALGSNDLREMIAAVLEAAIGPKSWRTVETGHPYTVGGVQIDVNERHSWLEVGECGVAHPAVLRDSGLAVPPTSGLAMGLGLDRLLMIRKGMDDIRLLRSTDPRIATQLLDLEPYRPVSSMPPVKRDISIAVAAETSAETLGDRIRVALADGAASVESVQVLDETPYDQLPRAARDRLGMSPEQKNLLVRVVLRDLERTLTDVDANALRDRIYAAIHEGSVWAWASAE